MNFVAEIHTGGLHLTVQQGPPLILNAATRPASQPASLP